MSTVLCSLSWSNPWSVVCSAAWEVRNCEILCSITLVVVVITFISMLRVFLYSSSVVDGCLLNAQI